MVQDNSSFGFEALDICIEANTTYDITHPANLIWALAYRPLLIC